MNLHTPYTSDKNDKKELLLQQQYKTDENNAVYNQLTFPNGGNDYEGKQLELNQVMHAIEKIKKPKRNQVKNACVNCQKACKKCDEGRPCQRCIKYNLVQTCQDSVRKVRKKGVKRGPYKCSKTKKTIERKLQKETFLQQWPVYNETTKVSASNGSQQQAKQMSVSPNHREECEMKFVTPPLHAMASNHDSMSKYTANAPKIYFDLYHPTIYSDTLGNNNNNNTNPNGGINYHYDNNNLTTMPSPMSNHNDSSVIMTSNDSYMPSIPHEQEITNLHTFYIPIDNMHLENGANFYGTPTGSPIQLHSHSHQDTGVPSWGVIDHRFSSSPADPF